MQLEEAVGPLFRAATALGPEAAAQPSASRAHMGELLQWLLPEVIATADVEGHLVSSRRVNGMRKGKPLSHTHVSTLIPFFLEGKPSRARRA